MKDTSPRLESPVLAAEKVASVVPIRQNLITASPVDPSKYSLWGPEAQANCSYRSL